MMDRLQDMLFRRLHRRNLRLWEQAADVAETVDLPRLRQMRTDVRQVRRRLDRINHIASARLAIPHISGERIPKPAQADWAHRPEVWRGPIAPSGIASAQNKASVGSQIKLHHDCTASEIVLRQVQNTRAEDLAPFGLHMDVFGFTGTFLSFAIDLPKDVTTDLTRDHIMRIEISLEGDVDRPVFARLNIKNGPNIEKLSQQIPQGSGQHAVDYDLGPTRLHEKRIEHVWLDLIFDQPAMSAVTIRDLTASRRPRATF
ncbi:DUF6478 family protein [Litoreibacter roseus]|uniref:Uncharacterized protein n=1 Tax=Litoreibacter roseus TaxID=2601869 RepID=A0A6N6JEW7_9RHOB|nr:DUF6478 family protein [Litoreibacter roseus]GFE64487.1 hypothetical protein KIN_15610 [Litoreibacter roseus]